MTLTLSDSEIFRMLSVNIPAGLFEAEKKLTMQIFLECIFYFEY